MAIDISERYQVGVIMIASQEQSDTIADSVTDHGIVTVPRPTTARILRRSARLLYALTNRLKKTEKKLMRTEDKMEEIRTVNRAKWCLIENKGFSEDEAHRYIGKLAMDECISKREAAEQIISSYE